VSGWNALGPAGDAPPSPAAREDLRAWFDERARPLVAEAAPLCADGAWRPARTVHCSTCLHRDPAEVEARMRFHREREQAAASA